MVTILICLYNNNNIGCTLFEDRYNYNVKIYHFKQIKKTLLLYAENTITLQKRTGYLKKSLIVAN